MVKYILLIIASSMLLLNSCNSVQSQVPGTSLPPVEFAEKIKAMPFAPVIDVRTPEEFAEGHLQNARNIDWNGNNFQAEILKLDKSIAVFIYCHSGKRSAAAASKMRSEGFKEVYELQGGITKWREDNLPETTE